jgi:hypothetical protein
MDMTMVCTICEIIIALSIAIVWGLRYDNIKKEFKEYGYTDNFRKFIGLSKIFLSLLLIAAIWYPEIALIPATVMAILMLGAQYSHFKIKNPWHKFMPSLSLFILCLIIISQNI